MRNKNEDRRRISGEAAPRGWPGNRTAVQGPGGSSSGGQRLAGRVAVVSGAAAGIGRATAELFAEEGARVVLADIAGEAVREAAAAIREAGGEALAVAADVSEETGVEAVIGAAERGLGPVEVLVNNAGVELKKLVEDTSLAEWERILRTNLTSAFLMSRRVVPGMKERRRGAIVMNSSVGNFIAATRSSAYGASKAGMMALARGLALEGAPYGIRVNAVCPGVIATPMNERNLARAEDPEAMRRSWYEVTPLGRLGTPRDVAHAILFLASDESSFVTGLPLVIDGGRLIQ